MANLQLIRSTPVTSGTNVSSAFASVTAGSTLIVKGWLRSENNSILSIVDSTGDTWVDTNVRTTDGGSIFCSDLWILENASAGVHSLTITLASATAGAFVTLIEESGVLADSWATGQAVGGGANATTASSGSVTPAQAACVVYALGSQYDTGNNLQALGGAWTDLGEFSSGNFLDRISRQEPNSVSAISVTQTQGSGASPKISQVIVLRQVAGPTITVQPANDVGIISNGQSTVYTATATGTDVLAPTWSEDGTPIADGGVYDIVTTGAGTASCSSTLTITRTDKTGTPFDIAANFEDDNGDTDTDTVTDTWWTGPELTTFPATDGSGESQATLTSDYVTGVGEAIEVRIPLSDGDVAVTVTTTA